MSNGEDGNFCVEKISCCLEKDERTWGAFFGEVGAVVDEGVLGRKLVVAVMSRFDKLD